MSVWSGLKSRLGLGRNGNAPDVAAHFNSSYTTGTKQVLHGVHVINDDCIEYGCAIHSPSDHPMRKWPTHWRDDRYLMERICPHGVGHPDPDHLSWKLRAAHAHGSARDIANAEVEGVHGCDGCCGG